MLKLLVQGEADVSAGRHVPQGKVFADLRKRLESLGSGGG
jgi:predicted transcriptional regulator